MKVRAKSAYRYEPVLIDRCNPPFGIAQGLLKTGDYVVVVNMPGCPKANTMNHCHIQTLTGKFAGLVCCNSLTK